MSLSDPRICRLENVSSLEEFSAESALLVVSPWLRAEKGAHDAEHLLAIVANVRGALTLQYTLL